MAVDTATGRRIPSREGDTQEEEVGDAGSREGALPLRVTDGLRGDEMSGDSTFCLRFQRNSRRLLVLTSADFGFPLSLPATAGGVALCCGLDPVSDLVPGSTKTVESKAGKRESSL